MPVSNHMQPGMGPRFMVKILTVDPPTRKIEAALKDSGLIHIAVFDTPQTFIWPQVGEYWAVRKENGMWMLDKRVNATDEHTIDNINPGEAKIHADKIYNLSGSALVSVDEEDVAEGDVLTYQEGKWTAQVPEIIKIADDQVQISADIIKTQSGKNIISVSDFDYNEWADLELINGWEDSSSFNETTMAAVSSLLSLDIEYLTDLPPASYQYNPFTKSIYFQGLIYNENYAKEVAVIPHYPNKLVLGLGATLYLDTNGSFGFSASGSGESAIMLNGLYIQISNST